VWPAVDVAWVPCPRQSGSADLEVGTAPLCGAESIANGDGADLKVSATRARLPRFIGVPPVPGVSTFGLNPNVDCVTLRR